MGFSSVYRILQEVFPQVDSRILRAVAIEHAKDADLAVEAVITEVIPQLAEKSAAVSSFNKSNSSPSSSEDRGKTVQLDATVYPVDVIPSLSEQSTEVGSSNSNGTLTGTNKAINAGPFVQINSPTVLEPVILGPLGSSSPHETKDATEVVSDAAPLDLEKSGDDNIITSDSSSMSEKSSYDNLDQECVKTGSENVAASFDESVVNVNEASGFFYEDDTIQLGATVLESTNDDNYIHLDVNTETSIPPTTTEKDAFTDEIINPEDESTMTSVLTRSEQKCSTELLEEIIEDARNNKIALVTSMNSVVDLIKEVESKEKIAEEVKEEASQGCSYYYAKVDELKHALLRAKEANDMHAGEVYAEKAILATELKELQLRLLTLSDERNKSLAILDEMREALEIRLAQALEDIKAADEEKLEKEKSAREALLFQESQMEKVVEDSKKLKLEAEENSKLQEYLMDRGRTIDILQGEIFVKCQDVLLLKEKFDKRIPLSRILSSSQTSSILASSSSSFKSTGLRLEPEPEPEPEPVPESYESPKKGPELDDSYGFLEKSSSKSAEVFESPIKTRFWGNDQFPSGEEEKQIDVGSAALVDDGWELFEKEDYILGI